MFSLKSIALIAAAFVIGTEASGVAVPAALAAPVVAQAHIGYSQTIPQNILPYASQVSLYNRALAAPYAFAAPAALPAPVAAPLAAPYAAPYPVPAPFAGPVAARFATPYSAPYFAAPAGEAVFPSPYAAAYPYAYRAPLAAPAFVR